MALAAIRKPKKNLLPPFTDPKWALHPNAKVISPYELELAATGNSQTSTINIAALPGATYSINVPNSPRVNAILYTKDNGFIAEHITSNDTVTFTATSDCSYITFRLTNASDGVGVYTFKNPMFHQGNTLEPFEPYVELNPPAVTFLRKNLLNEKYFTLYAQSEIVDDGTFLICNNGLYGGYQFEGISVVSGKSYTLSFVYKSSDDIGWYDINDGNIGLFGSNVTLNLISDGIERVKTLTFVASKTTTIKIRLLRQANDGTVFYKKGTIQLEEGTTATPYEPYKVGNRKFVDGVPKKNLVETNAERWGQFTRNQSAGGSPTFSPTRIGALEHVEVKESKSYTISAESGYRVVAQCHVGANTSVPTLLDTGWQSNHTFIAPVGTKVIYLLLKKEDDSNIVPSEVANGKPQLEEGGSTTTFAPFLKVNTPSSTGVIMDAVTNYVQLPSMTMDRLEIDCLVDATQKYPTYYVVDNRDGASTGYVYYAGGWNFGNDILSVEGLVTGKRTKLNIQFKQSFVDDVSIFARYNAIEKLNGTIYGVKCYLNGKIVAEYDFTKENAKANSVLFGTKTWQQKQAKR